jgi:hypothetical protein
MADHVPTGAIAPLREDRVAAGDVFLWMYGIDLVFNFIAFRGDGEKADTMNGAGGLS